MQKEFTVRDSRKGTNGMTAHLFVSEKILVFVLKCDLEEDEGYVSHTAPLPSLSSRTSQESSLPHEMKGFHLV